MIGIITDNSSISKSRIERLIELTLETTRSSITGLHIEFLNIIQIQELNHKFRNTDAPTDVVSLEDPEDMFHEIYICEEMVKQNSVKFNEELSVELDRVVVHGLLHVLGYDHEKNFGESDEEIYTIQESILKQIND